METAALPLTCIVSNITLLIYHIVEDLELYSLISYCTLNSCPERLVVLPFLVSHVSFANWCIKT